MSSKRILHVTSELSPYFEDGAIASAVNTLAVKSHQKGNDVRVFMPKFGFINERRFQLHEVIRLSGINLIINDLDQPLIVKVASLPGERMQIYFVDNEEYFKRKTVYFNEDNDFHQDNHERGIFFAKGVLETIKKLNWVPDIIHVHGWMGAFLPIYLKKVYVNDAIFKDCKVITSIYNFSSKINFADNFYDVLAFDGIQKNEFKHLNNANVIELINESLIHSDLIMKGEESLSESINDFYDKLYEKKSDFSFLGNLSQLYLSMLNEEVNI